MFISDTMSMLQNEKILHIMLHSKLPYVAKNKKKILHLTME